MRSTTHGRTLSTWLLLVAGLGALAYMAGTTRSLPALPDVLVFFQILQLFGQVAKGTNEEASGSALPTNLERTLIEVTKNFRKLVPRCTLEVAGQPRAAIPEYVRVALEMGLYNALSNAYSHGQAQAVHVR